jgi:hypothetical protein
VPAPIDLTPHVLRRRHIALLVELLEAAQQALLRPEAVQAAERFFGRPFRQAEGVRAALAEQEVQSHFYPWLLWDAEVSGASFGRSLLRLRRGSGRARLVAALEATSPQVWQVLDVDERRGDATLRRLGDRAERRVHEPVLGLVAAPGELLIARVFAVESVNLVDAVHLVLPAEARATMLRAARRAAAAPREARLKVLLSAAARGLLRLAAPLSGLRAPDGGPLLRVEVAFAVDDAAALRASLASACAAGALVVAAGGWRCGAEVHALEGVHLRVCGRRVLALTSSLERAELLRARLPTLLAGLRPTLTSVRDLGALLDDRPDHEAGDGLARMSRDWLEEALTGLDDRPLPTLGGATPRELMATRGGSGRVRAALRSLETLGALAGPDGMLRVERFWQGLQPPAPRVAAVPAARRSASAAQKRVARPNPKRP